MGRAGRIALALLALAVLALVLGQLLLPPLAAQRIRSKIGKYGRVQSVSASAWPAVQLLWGSADTVKVRALRLRMAPADTAKLLWEARGVSRLELSAARLQEGPLRLTDVSLSKHGARLEARAHIAQKDASAALPPGLSVALLASEGGSVKVRASGGLFGVRASVDALAGPQEGRLVAHPLGLLLEGLQLTLFSDPHVYVEGVGASTLADAGGEPGYSLSISARLR